MKSLEIVNYCLENINKGENVHIFEYEFQQIKQDLEVLEILRKYLYLYTYIADADYGDREDRTIQMNMIEEMFSYADYNQVKQWLEENE